MFRASRWSVNSKTVGLSAGASKYPTRWFFVPISIGPASIRNVTGLPPLCTAEAEMRMRYVPRSGG